MKSYTVVPVLDSFQVVNPEGQTVKYFPDRDTAEWYAGQRSGQRFNGLDTIRAEIITVAKRAYMQGDETALLAAQGQLLQMEPSR